MNQRTAYQASPSCPILTFDDPKSDVGWQRSLTMTMVALACDHEMVKPFGARFLHGLEI